MVFKHQNNLCDLLVKSEFPTRKKQGIPTLPPGNYICGNSVQCAFMQKCNSFSHPRTGRNISISGTTTCASTHVIYLILAYVGKTSDNYVLALVNTAVILEQEICVVL